MRWAVGLVLLCALLAPAACEKKVTAPLRPADVGPRIALVVGNSRYATGELPNPVNDAKLIRGALQQAGFDDVTLLLDATRAEFVRSLDEFERKALTSSVALVYFAGHGSELEGRNFLYPVDVSPPIDSARKLADQTISLDSLLSAVEGATELRVVILDACRTNPINKFRSTAGGLASINLTTRDTLIVFAAEAGKFAYDGAGKNSPFATALDKHLPTPGLDVQLVMRRVGDDVREATDEGQAPWQHAILRGKELYLVPPDRLISAFSGRWSSDSAACDDAFALRDLAGELEMVVRRETRRMPVTARPARRTMQAEGAEGVSTYSLENDDETLVLTTQGGASTRFFRCA